jgi:hypothetical protein
MSIGRGIIQTTGGKAREMNGKEARPKFTKRFENESAYGFPAGCKKGRNPPMTGPIMGPGVLDNPSPEG